MITALIKEETSAIKTASLSATREKSNPKGRLRKIATVSFLNTAGRIPRESRKDKATMARESLFLAVSETLPRTGRRKAPAVGIKTMERSIKELCIFRGCQSLLKTADACDFLLAGSTGFGPAVSTVTGWRVRPGYTTTPKGRNTDFSLNYAFWQ